MATQTKQKLICPDGKVRTCVVTDTYARVQVKGLCVSGSVEEGKFVPWEHTPNRGVFSALYVTRRGYLSGEKKYLLDPTQPENKPVEVLTLKDVQDSEGEIMLVPLEVGAVAKALHLYSSAVDTPFNLNKVRLGLCKLHKLKPCSAFSRVRVRPCLSLDMEGDWLGALEEIIVQLQKP